MNYVELFGEELGPKVKENMPENYVLVKEENHVTKESFNTERDKLKNKIEALESEINERDNQINQLKNDTQASKELQEKIEELQEKNEQTRQELETKLESKDLNYKLDLYLREEGARSPKAVKALLNMEKIKLEDGKLTGHVDQIKDVKESDDYLFGKLGLEGDDPEPGGGPAGDEYKDNPFKDGSINLTKQGQLIRNDPDKAKKLINAAGGEPAKYGL